MSKGVVLSDGIKQARLALNDDKRVCEHHVQIELLELYEDYLFLTIYPKWYWETPQGDRVLALGKKDSLEKANDEPGHAELLKTLEGKKGKWFGGIGFSESINRHWKGIPQEWFFSPYVLLESSLGQTTLSVYWTQDNFENDKTAILEILEKIETSTPWVNTTDVPSLRERSDTPGITNWKNTISDILREINEKQYGKCVLARLTTLSFSHPISSTQLFLDVGKNQLNCYKVFVSLSEDMAWVSFTPEILYKRHHRQVESMALAGTMPRGSNLELDMILEKELLQSDKEMKEHRYVSDFIRDKLTLSCESLAESESGTILKQQYVQHVMHEFNGQLKPDVSDADLVASLHPTPAVCGYPQQRAFESIRRNEPFDRGWYAGVLGYVSDDSSEWIVGIRSALFRNQTLYVYAGAGIVKGSEAEKEWQEIDYKMKPFLTWAGDLG